MNRVLNIAQLVVSTLLMVLILFQKGKGTGQLVGNQGRFYRTLRGAEKKIFWGTAILGFAFIVLGVLNLTF